MSKATNRLKENWQKKNLFGKITDVLIIIFIITLFIPQGRMAVGGFVNRIKAMIIAPGEMPQDEQETLSIDDYNWKLQDINGKELLLSEAKGKVIFINLWATWCPPCVGEMPEIQELWEKYRDNKDVAVFLISNEDNQTVQAFLDKRDYNFPVYTTQFKAPALLQSRSIPTSFIISKNREIVVKETGAANWGGKKTEELINRLIAE